ncbi:hypothetical protein K438DRAFT_1750380 [Mycena galopus ATCC 62051]|nr:hypothetical protein K438DRAFT_1750380 [Mycena galopus ATCC 62051]
MAARSAAFGKYGCILTASAGCEIFWSGSQPSLKFRFTSWILELVTSYTTTIRECRLAEHANGHGEDSDVGTAKQKQQRESSKGQGYSGEKCSRLGQRAWSYGQTPVRSAYTHNCSKPTSA